MSQVIKLVNTLTIRKQYLNGVKYIRQYSNISKEIIRQNKQMVAPSQDLLYDNLKSATNTKYILDIVNSHNKIMNNKHLMQALRSLFTLQKQGNSELSTQQILKHPDFDKLCNNLKFKAGLIELNDTIEALKVVCYVGVQSNSTITQVLLQLLRHQINQLSIHQIIFLDFLLGQLKSTPLVEALQIALPIVFEIQLKTKIDHENLIHLTECLQYAANKDVSDTCLEFIINSLMNLNFEIDAKNATSIIWSLCELEPDAFFEPLLTRAIASLNIHLDDLNYREMETTLSKLVNRYTNKFSFYYNEVFFDVCANYVIDNDLGFKHGIYILRKYSKVYHANNKILDYIATKIHEDSNVFKSADYSIPYILTTSIAQTDYRPKYWDEIKQLIQTTDLFKHSTRAVLWLKLVSSLCILDIYKPEIIERAFREEYLNQILQRGYWSDVDSYLLTIQAVNLYKPEYKNMLPSSSVTSSFYNKLKSFDFPLEAALEKGLGGDQYVKTKVTSELFHKIDHVLVLRKGGYPVAFKSNETPNILEKIEVPDNHQMVLILNLTYFNYTANKRLKGSALLKIKTLESKGYSVVPVCLEIWENLQDFEKVPYLMQAIKEKSDCNDLLSNSAY